MSSQARAWMRKPSRWQRGSCRHLTTCARLSATPLLYDESSDPVIQYAPAPPACQQPREASPLDECFQRSDACTTGDRIGDQAVASTSTWICPGLDDTWCWW